MAAAAPMVCVCVCVCAHHVQLKGGNIVLKIFSFISFLFCFFYFRSKLITSIKNPMNREENPKKTKWSIRGRCCAIEPALSWFELKLKS